MRRIFTLLFVLVCSAAFAQGVPAPQTPRPMVDSAGSLLSDTSPMPVKLMSGLATAGVGVQIDANAGPLNVSTPTIPLPANVATTISSYLPTGTHGVYISAYGADVLMGYSSDLSSSVPYIGVKIASGSSGTWSGITSAGAGNLALLPIGASAATATIVCW
jgi:hypothetical protein